jgi:hypothetical protein
MVLEHRAVRVADRAGRPQSIFGDGGGQLLPAALLAQVAAEQVAQRAERERLVGVERQRLVGEAGAGLVPALEKEDVFGVPRELGRVEVADFHGVILHRESAICCRADGPQLCLTPQGLIPIFIPLT